MVSDKTTAKRKKKSPKRRLHRGRFSALVGIFLILIVLIVVLLSKCSDDAGTEFQPDENVTQHIPTAVEAGRNDAKAVVSTAPGSMEREKALLIIKSHESRLRMAGYPRAANDYINAATEHLQKHKINNKRIIRK